MRMRPTARLAQRSRVTREPRCPRVVTERASRRGPSRGRRGGGAPGLGSSWRRPQGGAERGRDGARGVRRSLRQRLGFPAPTRAYIADDRYVRDRWTPWMASSGVSRPVASSTVLLVGLTGGIGAGKSTVAELLTERGAIVIDGDLIARAGGGTGAARAGGDRGALRRRRPRPGTAPSIGRRWPRRRSRATRTARRWRRSPIRRSARSSCAR